MAASISNFLIMEEGNTDRETEIYKEVFGGAWKPDLASWEVPGRPGLGVDFSAEFLREHQVKLDWVAG